MGDDSMPQGTPPPIIYFHEGFSPYLPFTLWQATQSNPDARTILLGDPDNRLKGIPYEHYLISDYGQRHEEFLRLYRHFHPGCLEDERRCIERWIYLAEFVQRNRIDEFLFLDSDVVLMEELRGIFAQCRGYDAGGAPSFFGFCAFRKKNLVPDFADWILEQYGNPAVMRAWGGRFEAYRRGKKDPGAVIQDMALAQMFIDERGVRVLDLAVPQNGKMVDSGHYGRAFQHGTQEEDILIQARPGGPVSTMLHGKRVDLLAVHVNGYYKNHLPGITGWSGPVVRSFFRPNYRRNLKQLCLYLWRGWRFRNYLRRNHGKYLPPMSAHPPTTRRRGTQGSIR